MKTITKTLELSDEDYKEFVFLNDEIGAATERRYREKLERGDELLSSVEIIDEDYTARIYAIYSDSDCLCYFFLDIYHDDDVVFVQEEFVLDEPNTYITDDEKITFNITIGGEKDA